MQIIYADDDGCWHIVHTSNMVIPSRIIRSAVRAKCNTTAHQAKKTVLKARVANNLAKIIDPGK